MGGCAGLHVSLGSCCFDDDGGESLQEINVDAEDVNVQTGAFFSPAVL